MKTNYRMQSNCDNCKHVFKRYEHDEGTVLLCHSDKSDRPRCGSVALREEFKYETTDEEFKMWDKWTDGRHVEEDCICDDWEAGGGWEDGWKNEQ